jgi:cytochrome c556
MRVGAASCRAILPTRVVARAVHGFVIGGRAGAGNFFPGIRSWAPVFASVPTAKKVDVSGAFQRASPHPEGDHQMKRFALVATLLALGGSFALAQQDPIAARKAIMKKNGDEAKIGTQFMKGEAPFDLAKAKAIFATYQDAASKMPNLFPDNSKTGGETAALPAIWEKKDDVVAKFKKFGEDAKEAATKVTDEASFKTVFPTVQKNCGGCHETYRLKKS